MLGCVWFPHWPRTALDLNAEILWPVAETWVDIFDFEASGNVARTFPVKMAHIEAALCFLGSCRLRYIERKQ